MNRVWTLVAFLTRDLFHSLAGILPLAAALAFGIIAFEYGMDQPQFITVAGVGLGAICFMTTLLLASRVNRASSYLLVARLHRRAELLASMILSGLGISIVLAILIAVGNLLTARLTLDCPSFLWIVPTWLALWLLIAALALSLSALVERSGSHLFGYVLLACLLIANDRKSALAARGLDWLVEVINAILWPVNTLLSQASAGTYTPSYFMALAMTLVYVVLFFVLAVSFFQDKDLLWSE
jgi:hypothetical protein